MYFRTIAFLSALSVASAGKHLVIPTNDIDASSPLGSRILSAARRLENKDNQQYTDWVIGYAIKFEKCAVSDEYYGGYFGGQNGQQQNNNNRQQYNGMYQQRLVHFKLCPIDTCEAGTKSNSCKNGAEYVLDMNSFVEAYVEAKLTAVQYNCEKVRENCYCDDATDDDVCMATCYANAGLTGSCEEQNNQNNNNNGQNAVEFNLQEAVECSEVKGYDKDTLQYYLSQSGNNQAQYYYNYNGNNNKNNEMKLRMGPYCSADGKSIFMGLFLDETCSVTAPSGLWEKLSYGQAMPYSTTSLVEHNCMSCVEPANNKNDGDAEDADALLEVCENVYTEAGKCETGLADGVAYYKNEAGCSYIASLHAPGKKAKGEGVAASKVFAGLFAVTTIVFGGVAYHMYQKVSRQKVNLTTADGSLA